MQPIITTRRQFVQKGLALLAAGATVPAFINQTVMAVSNPADIARTQQPSGKDGKILVVVQLSGGNDGLNTIIPFADDAYHKARPQIRFEPANVLKIDDSLGMHPNLAGLKALYDQGLMSIVQGVGYPNPNRSHFRSMDIWHTAEPEGTRNTSGWVGRYFDNACSGCDPHVGISVGKALPLAMQGEKITPLSFDRPESFRYQGPDPAAYAKVNSPAKQPTWQVPTTAQAELDFLTRTAMDAQMTSATIARVTSGYKPVGDYPRNEFGNSLRSVAAMIAGGLPTRVYYVSLGGFDTHAGQRNRHDRLMTDLAAGVAAFWKDMAEQKNQQRVLMMSFSEFGRRVAQNGSLGTDHGAAAPMFLFGPMVTSGVIGKHPSLTDLVQGDLKYGTDFRQVYSAILSQWLQTDPTPILGRSFRPAGVLKA